MAIFAVYLSENAEVNGRRGTGGGRACHVGGAMAAGLVGGARVSELVEVMVGELGVPKRAELAESEKNGNFVGYETGSGYHILLAANRGERGAAMG